MATHQRINQFAFSIVFAVSLVFPFDTETSAALRSSPHMTLKQHDGSSLEVHKWRDQYGRGWETLDGRTVMFNWQLQSWTYAFPGKDGALEPSGFIAGKAPARASSIPRHIRPKHTRAESLAARNTEKRAGSY